MRKPGQFVWYKGKRYRLVHNTKSISCCRLCRFRNSGEEPCRKLCNDKTPVYCYPKLDMPKLKRSE